VWGHPAAASVRDTRGRRGATERVKRGLGRTTIVTKRDNLAEDNATKEEEAEREKRRKKKGGVELQTKPSDGGHQKRRKDVTERHLTTKNFPFEKKPREEKSKLSKKKGKRDPDDETGFCTKRRGERSLHIRL